MSGRQTVCYQAFVTAALLTWGLAWGGDGLIHENGKDFSDALGLNDLSLATRGANDRYDRGRPPLERIVLPAGTHSCEVYKTESGRGYGGVRDDRGHALRARGRIHFATNRAEILPESQTILAEWGIALAAGGPHSRFLVQGHADNRGSHAHNLDLSRQRAQSVIDHLVDGYGIDRERLLARGCSFDLPLQSNDSDTNRALNRRVEVVRVE